MCKKNIPLSIIDLGTAENCWFACKNTGIDLCRLAYLTPSSFFFFFLKVGGASIHYRNKVSNKS